MLEIDIKFMKMAIAEAKKCKTVDSAFDVGAVLVAADGKTIIAKGFSRELPGNTHAEECCLLKLSNTSAASGATIYSTMEPCGERLSGKTCCSTLLIGAGIKRVVQGVKEPSKFIADSVGTRMLRDSGVMVDYLCELENECASLNS